MKSGLLIGLAALSMTVAYAAKDPILMTINGKGVKLSEFEYLYHKNNQQQLQKETLDQYVNRFVTYKLKVADAEANKIDTLKSFNHEFEGYKSDIVKKFLEDTTVYDAVMKENYKRFTKNVDVSQIMISRSSDYPGDLKQEKTLDSIRTCILNGQDFGELAMKYSSDRSAPSNKGHMGFIPAGKLPYPFETAAYQTPVGQISKPFKTRFGVHIVKVNGIRDDRGTVHVEHILRLFPRGANDSAKMVVKAKADSIYNAVKAGSNFEELAKTLSEDKGSAPNGGLLPWFGSGEMIKSFEDVAFDLKDGEISKPFATAYGYHIIKKLASKPTPSFAEMRKTLRDRFDADFDLAAMPKNAKLAELKKKYKYSQNSKLTSYLTEELKKHGGFDSVFVDGIMAKSNFVAATFAKNQKILVSDLAANINPKAKWSADDAIKGITHKVDQVADDEIAKYYTNDLIAHNADLKNLLNEYRDGMLLFEISNRMVWERASRDTTGLKSFFEANRAKYTWDKPHFKGIVLLAQNDSILKAVKDDIKKVGADSLTMALHKKYQNKIKMERYLCEKGENKMVDYLAFNGPKAESSDKKYPLFFTLSGKVLDQPEEVNDVKGLVTSDYQDVLEKRWDAYLKKAYKVEINKDVLRQVK